MFISGPKKGEQIVFECWEKNSIIFTNKHLSKDNMNITIDGLSVDMKTQ